LFMATYSLFEDILKKICKVLIIQKHDEIDINKWFKGVLQKSKDLFVRNDILTEDEIFERYEIINYLRIIRNSIVHRNGYLFDKDKEHAELLVKIKSEFSILAYIEIKRVEENYIIKITQYFFTNALSSLKDYLIFLLNSIYDG